MQGRKPPPLPLGELLILPLRPSLKVPDPPKTLPEGLARECWTEVVQELLARGIYDTDLRDMVEAYCVQRARFIQANAKVEEKGLMVKSKRGSGKYNPYVSISNAAFDRMVRLGQELGLTAVRRGSAQRGSSSGTKAGAEKFLSKRNPGP